jgi:phosphoribosylamine---glycine ligase
MLLMAASKKLRLLIVGGGGREHALAHVLARSRRVEKIYCAPGNAGIAREAECVKISADDQQQLAKFAKEQKVDLTIVGPEAPLVDGLVDYFKREGLLAFGPSKSASRLEGSKSFAKEFMHKYGIPTARYDVIPNLQKGSYQLTHWMGKSVLKADGLAAGKGVKVCQTQSEAKEFLFDLMQKEVFGSAGTTAVIEECLEGEEATVMAFCDGKTLVAMPASQDHKRLSDGDQGPNTGGMGAYAPAPCVTPALSKEIDEKILKPFLRGLQAEKFEYHGIVYFGLMLTKEGPKVLEFNVRFGDPETEVVLPLLESDLTEILLAVVNEKLAETPVRWKKEHALCVVLASAGYPQNFEKGKVVHGSVSKQSHAVIFHAGTQLQGAKTVTAGGRVLAVSACATSLEAARSAAYKAVEGVSFEGMVYRKDIGARALAVSGRAG